MNRIRRYLACVTGVGLLAFVLAITPAGPAIANSMKPLLVEVVNNAAAPVPVTATRFVADRVVLAGTFVPSPICTGPVNLVRVFPDATADTLPFVVPAGKVLVITDVQGKIEESVPWAAGEIGLFRVVITDGTQQTHFEVHGEVSSNVAASAGLLVVDTHFQSGRLAGSGMSICVGAGVSSGTTGKAALAIGAEVQGYLIDQ
ncbi:MAG: hypothetical protein ACRD5G_10400 [Candidatus Acidiferrales bacterium]